MNRSLWQRPRIGEPQLFFHALCWKWRGEHSYCWHGYKKTRNVTKRRPRVSFLDPYVSQCCLLQIKERGFAKEWDLAGKRNEVSPWAIYSQDLFSDTIPLWILMSTVWIFPFLIVTVFFFPQIFILVWYVLNLFCEVQMMTQGPRLKYISSSFLFLSDGTVLGHEVAKSYQNGFVTEME